MLERATGEDVVLFTHFKLQPARHLARDFLQEPVAGGEALAQRLHEALKPLITFDTRRLLRAVRQRRREGQPELHEQRKRLAEVSPDRKDATAASITADLETLRCKAKASTCFSRSGEK